MRSTRILVAVALLAFATGDAASQEPARQIEQGISAYRSLQYPEAMSLLGAAFRSPQIRSVPDSTVTRALVYLGASAILQGQRDSAAAVFRAALQINPRARPDTLIFPPEITDAFEVVRTRSFFVALKGTRDTTIVPGREQHIMKLFASAPQTVNVELRAGSRTVRTLHSGHLADSLQIVWNGLDDAGNVPRDTNLTLVVTSASGLGRGNAPALSARVTLGITRPELLAMPPAPDTVIRSVPVRAGVPMRSLAIGFLGGAAAIVLPAAIAGGDDAWSARYAVGAAIGTAGVVSFVSQIMKRERDMESSDARSREATRYRNQVATINAENQRRRNAVRMRIITELPSTRAGGDQL